MQKFWTLICTYLFMRYHSIALSSPWPLSLLASLCDWTLTTIAYDLYFIVSAQLNWTNKIWELMELLILSFLNFFLKHLFLYFFHKTDRHTHTSWFLRCTKKKKALIRGVYLGELLSRATLLAGDTVPPLVPVLIFLTIHDEETMGTENNCYWENQKIFKQWLSWHLVSVSS